MNFFTASIKRFSSSGDKSADAPRDNVLFELGLFMGRLGRSRTFVAYNKDAGLKLPSDLAGVTAAVRATVPSGRPEPDGDVAARPAVSSLDALVQGLAGRELVVVLDN